MKCADCELNHTFCNASNKEDCKGMCKKIKNNDNVNHPNHYLHGKIETIEIIKDITGEGFEGYLAGNVLKYISRYKYKNGVEDIKKALWYMNRLIKELEGEK